MGVNRGEGQLHVDVPLCINLAQPFLGNMRVLCSEIVVEGGSRSDVMCVW